MCMFRRRIDILCLSSSVDVGRFLYWLEGIRRLIISTIVLNLDFVHSFLANKINPTNFRWIFQVLQLFVFLFSSNFLSAAILKDERCEHCLIVI